ncbi:PTS fructose transporter subunit IIABC [uncultured Clostridium sp.]|uniref:PTS fructose transporter subunit IIABC n=1 Tax=uncultured Clostridium sp. TaxID=59620 RepID=UPI002634FD62|nr:PTS fructose transporter subunit IIABC [uncultured Clostridium sp.]
MRISDLLSKETITLNLEVNGKKDALEKMIDVLDNAGKLADRKLYEEEIWKRENSSSTGIGDGVGIPHAKTKGVKKAALAMGILKRGIEFEALDDAPVNLIFMIAAPEGANNEHLETLSKLAVLLMNGDFKKELLESKTAKDVLRVIDKYEEGDKPEFKEIDELEEKKKSKLILGVTACPTGIAHTYMAADSLKKTAEKLGYDIKVETNGSTGVKNALTTEEIERADGIIVAADKQVEMGRFNGKKVVIVPVVQAMKRPEELINESVSGNAPVYTHSGQSGSTGKKEKTGFYKHLMSGVSNMLPFVIGGGILIAISFMFGINSANPASGEFNRFAAMLKEIGGGNAFFLMVPVLAGFIGMSIADRPGFAPAMVGGLIAANQGAGFLGGLIAGFLGGYIVLLLKKAFEFIPQSLDGLKPMLIYPLLGIFLTGAIMFTVVVGPVSWIMKNVELFLTSMGTANLVLLGIFLGGMMAIDMGGPINKTAYTFAVAMLASGNFFSMAAVMAGGMVPPLATALASTIFKDKFNKEERNAGKTNYVLGASFITEGAIPFAAADPIRVIPACVVGSAIAGGLSMFFKIGLPAPHGGLFVFPIVEGNPFLYLVAVLIGTVVAALIMGAVKKKVVE